MKTNLSFILKDKISVIQVLLQHYTDLNRLLITARLFVHHSLDNFPSPLNINKQILNVLMLNPYFLELLKELFNDYLTTMLWYDITCIRIYINLAFLLQSLSVH